MAEVKELYPDYERSDIDLRNEVLMDMKKSYGRVKYQQTGDEKEPYTNDGVIKRKEQLNLKKQLKLFGKTLRINLASKIHQFLSQG